MTERCLMSLIGLLASKEKMVPEGRLHMRPFQFHLKEHWRYPQSLDSLLPWTETISAHLEWWENPTNVMKGADHSIQLFTPQMKAHLEQGFSVEVAERIAAPQRSSTRTIYKSKWALFEKWCSLRTRLLWWRWQRELLPLRGHQQGPSTSQSGPYLRNGAEKIRWISPLPL